MPSVRRLQLLSSHQENCQNLSSITFIAFFVISLHLYNDFMFKFFSSLTTREIILPRAPLSQSIVRLSSFASKASSSAPPTQSQPNPMAGTKSKSDDEWRAILNREQVSS
jgi:hypothetical protein